MITLTRLKPPGGSLTRNRHPWAGGGKLPGSRVKTTVDDPRRHAARSEHRRQGFAADALSGFSERGADQVCGGENLSQVKSFSVISLLMYTSIGEDPMIRTVEAVIDEHGNLRLLEPVHLTSARRALVTILDDHPATGVPDSALLSEAALAED